MKPLRRPSRRYLWGNDLTGTLPSQLGNLINLGYQRYPSGTIAYQCYLSYADATNDNSFDCPLPANLPDVCNPSPKQENSFECSPTVTKKACKKLKQSAEKQKAKWKRKEEKWEKKCSA